MIKYMQKYFSDIPPVFLDGCIAVLIASMTALNMSFATDDSAKYVDPTIRWYVLVFIGTLIQGLHALSKFRDKTYSAHMAAKQDEKKQQDEKGNV
jgi:hypothetical protein